MMRCFLWLVSLMFASLAPLSAQQGDRKGETQTPLPEHIKAPPAPVRSPEEEAATFQLAPGFRAELVAAEPLVGDPVAAQFGPDGRLWIVEMRGFMRTVDAAGERDPSGMVAVLEDTDNDGRFDRRTVFADKLVMPRALSLVGDGVLVAEPPHLWFFRDTNGDGKADEKTEIANDYGGTDNPEHTANGLMRAMDNWIYSSNHTVRFRYEGGKRFAREVTIARGQWGITQDDFGRIYYNNNSDPLRIDAIPAEFLRRNPNFAANGASVQVATPQALRLWPARVTPGVNRGYQNLDTEGKLRAVTATCGPVIYRGALFPEEMRGDAFIAEPSANLVKRIKLTERDAVVTGENAYRGTEFMTSTDERFRPVNLLNGPDGALYVVDFYRGILQHRIYMTSFLRKQILERQLDEGIDRGRIWRIVPEKAPQANFRQWRQLTNATTRDLVAKLEDPNGWVRDTVQRLLVERRDLSAGEQLNQLVSGQNKPRPTTQLHALWTLEGLGLLSDAAILSALESPSERVSAAGVRFARGARMPDVAETMFGLVEKRPEPEVRLQLALSLGEFRSSAADAALHALVVQAGRQRFLADAVVSGLAGREMEFVERLVKDEAAAEQGAAVIRFATSAVLKSGDAPRIERVFAVLADETTPTWARDAMLSGVRHFLPKSPEGRSLPGALPAEPKALLALAARPDTPHGKEAQSLLAELKWPDKAGAQGAAVRPLTAEEQARFERGKAQFAAFCAACHQPSGQGLPGLAPSLVYSKWVLGSPQILARIVLNGKTRENSVMPPWKGVLDDEAVAGLLTFLRRSWGHEADPVAVEVVAAARAATAKREEPFTEAELTALMQTLAPAAPR